MVRLKRFLDFSMLLEYKSGTMYEYGCIMLYLTIPNWDNILGKILDEDLFEPQNERYGKEPEPHCTILYGIHKDVSDQEVINMFSEIDKSDFDIYIDGKDCFYNKDFDVLKLNVNSKKLNDLNRLAKKLPHTSLFPDFKPHLTVAYLQKGMGNKYTDLDFKMKVSNIDKIVYSKTDGNMIDIA